MTLAATLVAPTLVAATLVASLSFILRLQFLHLQHVAPGAKRSERGS